jgi:hypothetical protein
VFSCPVDYTNVANTLSIIYIHIQTLLTTIAHEQKSLQDVRVRCTPGWTIMLYAEARQYKLQTRQVKPQFKQQQSRQG